jgi:peptidoglycan hydrolase-like protein with peptidoglycan-binding domain
MQMKLRHWIVVGTAFASASAFAAGDKQQRTQSDEQPQRSSASSSMHQSQQSQSQPAQQRQQVGAAHSEEQVKQVQEKLSGMGYDVGPVDGIVGPKTQSALREFQQDKGLQATGELNSQTLAAIEAGGASGAAGPAGPTGQAGSAGQTGSSMSQDRSSQSGSSSMGRDTGAQKESEPLKKTQ